MGRQKKWTISSVNRSFTENRPLQVIVWSRAASTSAKAWWRPSQYPKPARHQLINFIYNTTKETKADASYYGETLLQRCLLPEIRQKSDDHFVFQQNGAPSHRAKSTVKFLQRTVTNFIEPSVRPPNTPDLVLNPVDYALWIELCSRVSP